MGEPCSAHFAVNTSQFQEQKKKKKTDNVRGKSKANMSEAQPEDPFSTALRAITRLDHDKAVLAQDKLGLEGRVHDLTQELSSIQSSEADLQHEYLELQSELTTLTSENEALKKESGHSKSKHQNVGSLSPNSGQSSNL